jgi:hypothetical protein
MSKINFSETTLVIGTSQQVGLWDSTFQAIDEKVFS